MAAGQDIHIRQLIPLFSNGFGSLTQPSLRRDAASTTTHSTNDGIFLAAIAYSFSFLPLEISACAKEDMVGGMCGLLGSSKRASPIIAEFCGYARNVFISQPTRLLLHGFFLDASIMELWIFDRSGPYIYKRFNAH